MQLESPPDRRAAGRPAIADTVTEMRMKRHHFQAGVPAQRGIEG